jgi:hypothetical protein
MVPPCIHTFISIVKGHFQMNVLFNEVQEKQTYMREEENPIIMKNWRTNLILILKQLQIKKVTFDFN